MRITRVCTRGGDKGDTQLASGQHLAKDALRVECYGTIDELNSAIGVVRAFNEDPEVDASLKLIQNDLFNVGAMLSISPADRVEGMPAVGEAEVQRLEHLMESCQKDLRPLAEFILPSGGKAASLLHLARTICRRAERRCVTLSRNDPFPGEAAVVIYLNRLGDTLFVLSRWVAKRRGETEELWNKPPRPV